MKWISEGGPRALEHLPGLNPDSAASQLCGHQEVVYSLSFSSFNCKSKGTIIIPLPEIMQ